MPSRIRLVAAATKLRHSSGSAIGISGGIAGTFAARVAPGYSAMCSGR